MDPCCVHGMREVAREALRQVGQRFAVVSADEERRKAGKLGVWHNTRAWMNIRTQMEYDEGACRRRYFRLLIDW